MSTVLTAASMVACAHKGKVVVTGSPRLTVVGAGVLTFAGLAAAVVAPAAPDWCSLPVPANPPNKKCTKVFEVTGGAVPRLTVDGEPVVAQETLVASTDGSAAGVTPQPGLNAKANQTLLTAG